MTSNYAIEHKLESLIPIVNPSLKGYSGIEAALKYKIGTFQEIDSSDLVTEAYRIFYCSPLPESSDTIFNAFTLFRDFCRAKLIKRKIAIPIPIKEQYLLIYKELNAIFDGYEELRILFDRYFDVMYSFSNFMPAPRNLNGSKYHKGKGDRKLNNDFPSEYMRNLNDPRSGIYMREEMLEWLNGHLDEYGIRAMYELKPPYPINEYYGMDDSKLGVLKEYIRKSTALIESRFQ